MNVFISFPSLRLERLKMCDQNFIENVCTPLETRLHGKLGRYLPREFTEANDIIYIYIYMSSILKRLDIFLGQRLIARVYTPRFLIHFNLTHHHV